MIEYVFFDLDGTITEPSEGITNSAKYALEKFGVHVKSTAELLPFIGPPLQDSFQEFYGFDLHTSMRAVKLYRKHYKDHGIYQCSLYDNIEELFIKLKERGYKLAIATSKPEKYAEKILKHFNLDKYFDFIAGATFSAIRCKKSEVIKHALDNLNITDSSKVIMVGDRKHDVLGAKEHNIETIGVLYGFGSIEEFEEVNCKYVVSKALDILEILK